MQPAIEIDGSGQQQIECGEIERGGHEIEIGAGAENDGPRFQLRLG